MKSAPLQSSKRRFPLSTPSRQAKPSRAAASPALSHPIIQARLRISSPNDRSEQEADHIADMVMRNPPASSTAKLTDTLRASGAGSSSLAASLPDGYLARLAPRFGGLLPQVRLHVEEPTARALRAHAFTVVRDIVFAPGRFQRDRADGQKPALRQACSCGGECPKCRNESRERLRHAPESNADDPIEKASAADRIEEVSGQVDLDITKAAGGGMPMPKYVRHFFEPRFGHDFSRIRIHTGRRAASIAQGLQAAAFAFGSDIFFNTGEYRPDTGSGLGLLAHELAHAMQQEAGGISRRLIQRAIIPYRPITWADFLATPPANQNPAEGAGIFSKFDLIPSYAPVITAKPTKRGCKVGKIRAKEVETTAAPDPADLSKPEAVMDQDQSWALPRYTGNGNDFCTDEVTRCETEFDNIQVTVRANCEKSAGECERAFDRGDKAFGIAIGNDSVRVTRKADCRTTFLTKCQEITSKAATVKIGSTTVRTKADCKRSYFQQCLVSEVDERARLLRHEQGHFDITNVMARNARDSIRVKAASLSVKETGCGEDAARDAARNTYETNVGSGLRQLGNDWLAFKNTAQSDYDTQTAHGTNAAKQRDWEADIIAGLKTYVPANAPVTAPVQTPVSPPPTPAPSNPPPAPPPPATPKR